MDQPKVCRDVIYYTLKNDLTCFGTKEMQPSFPLVNKRIRKPCGRKSKDKTHNQSDGLWKQLSLPRLVLLNRWRFNFELLHWCKKSLESQAVFLTSLTEAAHQMKGMCEIAFPSISVSVLRTQTLRYRQDAEAGPCCSIRW